jgi:MFS family permease
MGRSDRPTFIRYIILGLTALVAVMLYLDRFCLGFVAPYIRENLGLSNRQVGFVLDAFFYTYAFGQIPGGLLSDRFGPRAMLALYLAVWSSLTGLMGLAHGMTALLFFRLGCGLFEAGAYPSCAGLIRRWIPYQRRGLASGIVSIGGRIGGAVVPVLTAYLMIHFVPVSTPSSFTSEDILDARGLAPVLLTPETAPVDATLGECMAHRVAAVLPAEVRHVLEPIAAQVGTELAEMAANSPGESRHRLFRKLLERHAVTVSALDAQALADALNQLLGQRDLISRAELERFRHRLPAEAAKFSDSATTSGADALARRNRLVLEAAFPEALRKIYGEGWRPVLLVYGGAGLWLALVFWFFVRSSPQHHPLVNDAEVKLIVESDPPTVLAARPVPAAVLWRGILTSRSLWLSAFVQFGTNFGWIFLGNLFPLYLQQAHQVPEIERGWMVSLPFMVSLPMLIVGGWWTDRMTRTFGARWGRALPLALTRLLASAAFLSCLLLNAPWPITIALCLFSLASDMGLPSVWAYCLDVGGRNVGLVLGWGNMWGNLGAAVSTSTLVFLQETLQGQAGWDAVFWTCGVVFLIIGIAAFAIDATRPIVPES